MQIEGQKVIDITQLVNVFQAQEGEIQHISGRIGQGKTYEATRRVINDILHGKVVYANWLIEFSEYEFDQRKSLHHAFWNFVLFRKRFYVFPQCKCTCDISRISCKSNFHYYNLDEFGVVDFLASLTDCTVYADEGQDIFDSYEGTNMSKKKRKSLTRTRHLNKTLVLISQRPQAIAVTARANVNMFFRCVRNWSWPFTHFKVYMTEDIDSQNMPLFDKEHMSVYSSHFADRKIYRSYNSWYLRAGIPRSQDVHFDAYDFTLKGRFLLLCSLLTSLLPIHGKQRSARSAPVAGGQTEMATLKNGERLNTIPVGGIKSPYMDDPKGDQDELPF